MVSELIRNILKIDSNFYNTCKLISYAEVSDTCN